MVLKSVGSSAITAVTDWLGHHAAVIPVSANGWTLLSLVPAAVGLASLAMGQLLVGLALFALAGLLDAIDGAVARARGERSAVGGYLDGMVDRFVEAALLVGLMIFGYPDWLLPAWLWLALLLFFGTTMTTFSRAYADHRGVVTDPARLDAMGGLLERPERLLLVYASMLLWLVEPILATYTIVLAAGLAAMTVLQRMVAVLGSD